MRNGLILLTLIFIFSILISSCSIERPTYAKQKVLSTINITDVEMCEQKSTIKINTPNSPRDVCFLQLAKKTLNESYCDKKLDFKDKCYIELAVLKNDGDICLKISSQADGENKNYCFYQVAVNHNRKELCEQIEQDVEIEYSHFSRKECYHFFDRS